MQKTSLLFVTVSVLCLFSCSRNKEEATRSFYLGVTPWPADFTLAEVNKAYQFIREDCDLVSHHFDEGIPYEEAFYNRPIPARLVQDVGFRKSNTAAGKKILLSVSVLDLTRKQRAGYYTDTAAGITDSVLAYWRQLPFNDPSTVTAYVNYIRYLVDELHPDYVNYGVESNTDGWDVVQFSRYKSFLSQCYTQLKAAFPDLPFFVSFMVYETPSALSLSRELLPYTDYIAVSAYPYTTVSSSANGNTDPALFPADYFSRFAELDPSKPFVFAETAYIAEDLQVPSFSLNKQGTLAWQKAYFEKVAAFCQQRNALFLVWFCYKDYDAANTTLQGLGLFQDLFKLWEDTGLVDENGQARPVLQSWRNWRQRTFRH